VARVAGAQKTLVSTQQLAACGLGKDAVAYRVRRLIKSAGLPMPDTNVKFGRFAADFVWREQKLIVELDSATYYSGPGVFQRDREKDLVFRGAGYDVMRPTRAHVVHQGPRVLVLLVKALAA
jgi:hypothetical protein